MTREEAIKVISNCPVNKGLNINYSVRPTDVLVAQATALLSLIS